MNQDFTAQLPRQESLLIPTEMLELLVKKVKQQMMVSEYENIIYFTFLIIFFFYFTNKLSRSIDNTTESGRDTQQTSRESYE